MKKQIYYCLLFYIVFFPGCRPVVKLIYGVKTPEFETEASLKRFNNQVGFDDSLLVGTRFELWKAEKLLHSPDVIVFDSKGRYIPYRDSLRPNCSGPAELFLAELKPGNNYNYSDLYTLTSFLELLEGPECRPIPKMEADEIDFYVFVTYAVFTGKKLIREKNLVWIKSLHNNKSIKYKLVLVNLDLKNCWSDEQKKFFEAKQ